MEEKKCLVLFCFIVKKKMGKGKDDCVEGELHTWCKRVPGPGPAQGFLLPALGVSKPPGDSAYCNRGYRNKDELDLSQRSHESSSASAHHSFLRSENPNTRGREALRAPRALLSVQRCAGAHQLNTQTAEILLAISVNLAARFWCGWFLCGTRHFTLTGD